MAANAFVLACMSACGQTSAGGGVVAARQQSAPPAATALLAEHFDALASGPYQPHGAALYANGIVCVDGQGCTTVDGTSIAAPGGGWACPADAVIAAREPHYPEMVAPAAAMTAWADRDASDAATGASSVSTTDEYCAGVAL